MTGDAAYFGGETRDCKTNGCLPAHVLVGGNTWVPQLLQDSRWRLAAFDDAEALNASVLAARDMLKKSARLSVSVSNSKGNAQAVVRVVNESGHKLPTGYPEGRRMWISLQAYDKRNQLIYVSGAYDPVTGVLATDPSLKVYEVKQGLTPELAAFLGKDPGESFHFVLNNTTIKDNRIPPRGYTVAAFNRPGMAPVGATYADGQYWDETVYAIPKHTQYVVATLYYQTSSKEYIDFLRTKGGPDGAMLGTLWDTLKSPPEVMAQASAVVGVRGGPPRRVHSPISVAPGTPALIDLFAEETDREEGDALTLIAVSPPQRGYATIVDNKLVYQPERGFAGEVVIEYTVRDSAANEYPGSVTVHVPGSVYFPWIGNHE
jgi:hypothetical protein